MWKWLARQIGVVEPVQAFSIEGIELDMPVEQVRAREAALGDGVSVRTRMSRQGDERAVSVSGSHLMVGGKIVGGPHDSPAEVARRVAPLIGRPRRNYLDHIWHFKFRGTRCLLIISDSTGLANGRVPVRGETSYFLTVDMMSEEIMADEASRYFEETLGTPRPRGMPPVDFFINGLRPGMAEPDGGCPPDVVCELGDDGRIYLVSGTELTWNGVVRLRAGDDESSGLALMPAGHGATHGAAGELQIAFSPFPLPNRAGQCLLTIFFDAGRVSKIMACRDGASYDRTEISAPGPPRQLVSTIWQEQSLS